MGATIIRNVIAIIFFLLVIAVLIVGGLIWFDVLGLVDAKQTFLPVLNTFGLAMPEPTYNLASPTLLDEERLSKLQEEIDLSRQELANRELTIADQEAEIQQILQSLTEREQTLEERENSFNLQQEQFDNKEDNLRRQSDYYVGMAPETAVEQFTLMSDQDVIELFLMTERIAQERRVGSVVSQWLSLLPADRAAEISRKMINRP